MSPVTYQRAQALERLGPVDFHPLAGLGIGQLVVLDRDLGFGFAIPIELHVDPAALSRPRRRGWICRA